VTSGAGAGESEFLKAQGVENVRASVSLAEAGRNFFSNFAENDGEGFLGQA